MSNFLYLNNKYHFATEISNENCEKIVEILIKNKIKSTWFITHNSSVFEKMKKLPELFELGIHPNFYPKSDHGDNEENILLNVTKFCP